MIIKNGLLFTHNYTFENLDIEFSKVINNIGAGLAGEDVYDATDCYIVPGFIDIHIHGGNGSDFCDGEEDALKTIATYLASQGVTSFCPTSMAYDIQTLSKVYASYKSYLNNSSEKTSNLIGINMEGPFLAKSKKGAHDEKYLINTDVDFINELNDISGGNIKFIDLAPEMPNALDDIKVLSKQFVVSLAHTSCDYDTAINAYKNGASHITHLFNAMAPFNHRQPGVIGAAIEQTKFAELICDGVHVHPSVVRAAFKMFGKDRICLISDGIRAMGLNDGDYTLGGQYVKVNNKKATLLDGTIAGSVTPLSQSIKNAVSYGLPLEDVIQTVTVNPAKACNVFDKYGSLQQGKQADIVILDKQLNIKAVFINGVKVV